MIFHIFILNIYPSMRPLFILIFLFSIFCRSHAQKNFGTHKDYNVKIKIPSTWIEKIRRYNYTSNREILIREFERFIKPDSMVNPHAEHNAEDYGRVLNPMFVDLDGEPGEELICLLGWDVTCPYLSVFKKLQDGWYLLYLESFDMFYSDPDFYVASSYSKNKTFYFRRVYNHGSGIYLDGFSFYKLINNKVYQCLNLINEASLYGWSLIDQFTSMTFKFSGSDADGILVNYTYNFFPGIINEEADSLNVNEDIHLVKGEGGVAYKWDSRRLIYRLNIESFQDKPEDLTAEKIACFGAFGNDSLFIKAFRREIDQTLATGTPLQKQILRKYLRLVKKGKTN